MGERFKNSRSRLERAGLHRKAFEAEFIYLFKGERSIVVINDDKHPGWWTVRLNFRSESVAKFQANQLSLVLGEFAYQLRAALDGLIWDAVTYTQGCELPPDTKGLSSLEFPLSPIWKAKDVDQNRFHGFPFPQSLIDWMKTIQRGTPDKAIDDPDRGLQNTLGDIHDLARLDRHRRLRLMSVLPFTQKISLIETAPPGGLIVDHEWLSANPLDGKYDLARIKVVGLEGLLPYKINLKPNFLFTVFAEDVEPHERKDIGVQLDRFIGAVGRVINRFEEEFS